MLKSQINLKLTEVQLDLVWKIVLVSCLSYVPLSKFQCPQFLIQFDDILDFLFLWTGFNLVLSATNLHPLSLTEGGSFHRILETTDTKFSAIWPCWQSIFNKQKEKATRLIDKNEQQIWVLI